MNFNERNETHFFIKIYLSHFILERGTQFVVSLRDGEKYTQRGLLLAPYLFPGTRGCQHLHPLASRIIRDDLTPLIGCVSLAQLSILTGLIVSISHRVVLIWRGHLLVTHLLDWPTPTHCYPPFTNHNLTACQSIQGHQERTQNPCQQSLYNIRILFNFFYGCILCISVEVVTVCVEVLFD